MPLDEVTLKSKILRNARINFSHPKLSKPWLSQQLENIIDTAGFPYFDYTYCSGALNDAILNASFREIAEIGTSGLSNHLQHRTPQSLLVGPIVLEIVHIIEVGRNTFEVEEVHQTRCNIQWEYRRSIMQSVTQSNPALRLLPPHYSTLPPYPRDRLKVFLSDGFLELEALETQRLPNLTLGRTPMGTKVRLTNVPILVGVAQITLQNVVVLGGEVPERELEHSVRLFRDMETRL
ncbi:hypothetical protein FA13DRAFT_1719542 [Coprinellus micaceus]|uniref:RecQ-mediated genome instability protein 1 n=1 Tax=Coprinellus micaceus TaxID=71717 RepID=A0A4Y7SBG6_COPMI|nr:hypothetical protein FA13DRAFT_1719542 [Coprinellus micaceus]